MAKIDSKKEVAAETDAEVTAPSGISIRVDREKYTTSRSAAGGKSLHNGDTIALALDGLNTDETYQLADKLIADNDFRERYAKLNPGMQRMNVGNRLRGFINADEANLAKLDKAVGPLHKVAAKRAAALTKERDDRAKAAAKAKAEKAAAEKKAA